jgi:vitamin-K-epoxide reductase (warfarin-sensitive)
MRYVIASLALAGIGVSFLALGEHYRAPARALDLLHSRWNSAYVNQSPYANVHGIPVAVLGIAGYIVLVILALMGRRVLMVCFSSFGLAYALYLTNIEAHILNVWCVYCVTSLVLSTSIAFLAFGWLLFDRTPQQKEEQHSIN